ncbi:MAG TPA: hypothetical protein VGB17_04955 [Pyrinomonadaceae bacterium]|jgi:hypothetical protein
MAGGLIFVAALLIFWLSPVHQLTDSNYSMLVSESLFKHGSFALDHYAIERRPPRYHDNTYKNGEMYQLELVGPHLYYYMPPGSSILSTPFVAVMNAFGISASNPDGTYNPDGEEMIETSLAAILMAALSSIFFFTSRLVLPLRWSLLIALASAFGTQLWSTASRALWSDTWAVLLLGIVVWMLLAQETKRRRLNPIVLASLLAWAYFVRPTNSVSILAITAYLFIFYRGLFVRYALAGAFWLAGFIIYSWTNFHQPLPNYFLANRLSFRSFGTAFAGNLISPSRGLFIFVPVLLFVFYLLVRYRETLVHKRLVLLSLLIIALHLLVIAGFTPWNGGFCYGPRYTTGILPWFLLLAVIAFQAKGSRRVDAASARDIRGKLELAAGAVLLLLSVLVNARGAIAQETWVWNLWPTNVDTVPGKIWDWREPQFLAGLVHPPLPREFPLMEGRVNLAAPEADKYLWYGWSWTEPRIRWSDGREAAIIFALEEAGDLALEIKLGPFLARGVVDEQRVELALNGQELEPLVLKDEAARVYSIALPKSLLKDKNILTFKLRDAVSPKALKLSDDRRLLGIRAEWMQLQSSGAGQ